MLTLLSDNARLAIIFWEEAMRTHVNWLSMIREPCNEVAAKTSRTFSNELRYSWLIWQPCERGLVSLTSLGSEV
jgi:hypothetical protein